MTKVVGIFYLTVRKNFCKINSVIKLKVEYELGDYKFEWDSDKAEKNWKKHKVRFETAARVFLDENNFDS